MSFMAQTGRRNLAVLYAYTATTRLWFDGGLWFIYFQHRGLSIFEVGVLEAVLHLVCLICDVPLGIFADHAGWKISLSLSALCGVAYTGLAIVSSNFWLAVLAFVFRGLQVTLANGSDSSMAYESAKLAGYANDYLKISGRLFAITLVSLGIAESIGGAIAAWSWNVLYFAFMAANLLSFFVSLGLREPRVSRAMHERPSAYISTKKAIAFARQNKTFTKWIVLSGTLSGVIATFAFYGQTLLLHDGWTLVAIGVLSGFENGAGAVISALTARIVDRLGVQRTMGVASALASFGVLTFAWLPGVAAGLGFLLDSVSGNLADPMIDQGLNELVPSEQRATLLSFNSTAFSIFMIVVFPLFGLLVETIGLKHAAYVGSAIGVVVILLSTRWWWTRPLETSASTQGVVARD